MHWARTLKKWHDPGGLHKGQLISKCLWVIFNSPKKRTKQAAKVSWVDHSIHKILSSLQVASRWPNVKLKFPWIYSKFWTKVTNPSKWIVGPLRRASRSKIRLYYILWYLKSNCFRSFFGRIEDIKKTFRN